MNNRSRFRCGQAGKFQERTAFSIFPVMAYGKRTISYHRAVGLFLGQTYRQLPYLFSRFFCRWINHNWIYSVFVLEAISDPVRRLKYCNAAPHRFPVHSVPVPIISGQIVTYTAGQNNKKTSSVSSSIRSIPSVFPNDNHHPRNCRKNNIQESSLLLPILRSGFLLPVLR